MAAATISGPIPSPGSRTIAGVSAAFAEMLSRTYSSTSGRAIEPSTASMNSSCRSCGQPLEVLGEPRPSARSARVVRLHGALLEPDALGPTSNPARSSRSRVSPTEA